MEERERLAAVEAGLSHLQDNFVRLEAKTDKLAVSMENGFSEMRGLIGAMNVAIGATNASVATLALTMERGFRFGCGTGSLQQRSREKRFAASDAALAAFSNAVEKRFAATDASIAALRLETSKSLNELRIWFLVTVAGVLSVMAKAFHWI